MIATLAAILAVISAGIPAILYFRNARAYRRLPAADPGAVASVSVLIPARNEERSIRDGVASVLGSVGVELEVLVMDDHSSDRTPSIVREMAAQDRRVRLENAPPLPAAWSGKQHACYQLALRAAHPLLVFIDADVRLEPDALARIAQQMAQTGVPLLSGFPRQATETFLEWLLLPLMHFVLLGFLPVEKMRASTNPAYAAGCGQLFAARADAYHQVGGHSQIAASFHDGITLPRAFRRRHLRTDLFDATDIARCRMYASAGQVWNGLAKNAVEGLASRGLILPATVTLLAGQVLPFVLAGLLAWHAGPGEPLALAAAACLLAWLPRFDAAFRFRQSVLGALLHPIGVSMLLLIQWWAFGRQLCGKPASWKGRAYTPPALAKGRVPRAGNTERLGIEPSSTRLAGRRRF